VLAAFKGLVAPKSPVIVIPAIIRPHSDITRAKVRVGINNYRAIVRGPRLSAGFGRDAEEKTAESEGGESGFTENGAK
jgi:hypothetical protein